MPGRVSLAAPQLPPLGNTRPQIPPLTRARALPSDGNGASNTAQAAGADLVIRMLADTSRINGLGGRMDILV